MEIDYEKEAGQLGLINWYKPLIGKHAIKILEEPVLIDKVFKLKDGKEELKQQMRLVIEEEKQKFNWDLGKGVSQQSAYGQIMLLGRHYKQLKDKVFNLTVVPGNQGRNNYLFDEALPLMKPKVEKIR